MKRALVGLVLLAAATPAFAGEAPDDEMSFDDDAAAAPQPVPGDAPDADPADGDAALTADEVDAPTELGATAAQKVTFLKGAGGGIAHVPGEDGGTLFNAEMIVGFRRARSDARLGGMIVGGTFDERSLFGVYLRLENVWHLGDRYSIGAGGMFGVVGLGANEYMDGETAVMVGPTFAPVVYRLGADRQHELSLWVGIQRNLVNDYITPSGSLSFDSFF